MQCACVWVERPLKCIIRGCGSRSIFSFCLKLQAQDNLLQFTIVGGKSDSESGEMGSGKWKVGEACGADGR